MKSQFPLSNAQEDDAGAISEKSSLSPNSNAPLAPASQYHHLIKTGVTPMKCSSQLTDR